MGGGLRFVDEESVRKNMRLSISRRIFYVVICRVKKLLFERLMKLSEQYRIKLCKDMVYKCKPCPCTFCIHYCETVNSE